MLRDLAAGQQEPPTGSEAPAERARDRRAKKEERPDALSFADGALQFFGKGFHGTA